jgi:hypothetical protein
MDGKVRKYDDSIKSYIQGGRSYEGHGSNRGCLTSTNDYSTCRTLFQKTWSNNVLHQIPPSDNKIHERSIPDFKFKIKINH